MAAPIVSAGSGTAAGGAATASASFGISGNTLSIVLTNTSPSTSGQDSPGSTLSGVFFALAGVAGLSVFDILNVSVQYGTSLSETNIPGSCSSNCTPPVPEPGSLARFGAALLAAVPPGTSSRPRRDPRKHTDFLMKSGISS
jgi:hypothetical protein